MTTTLLSLNEMRFYFTRAAVGAGAPFALGEEFARAASSLACLGFDPAAAVLPVLDGLARNGSDRDIIVGCRGATVHVAGRSGMPVSSLFAAPVVADRLTIAAMREPACRLHVEETDQPLLILAAAVGQTRLVWREPVLAEIANGCLRLDWPPGKGIEHCGPTPVEIDVNGPPAGLSDDALVIDLAEARRRAVTCGVAVDDRAWSGVYGYFRKCLVPSTGKSRNEGAGAGSIDNS